MLMDGLNQRRPFVAPYLHYANLWLKAVPHWPGMQFASLRGGVVLVLFVELVGRLPVVGAALHWLSNAGLRGFARWK